MSFEKVIGDIYRLKVPFDTLYTSVFLIKTKQGNALIDCATYTSDVDEYILPSLLDLGVKLTDISYLVLTHNHGDHAGGKERILKLNPKMKIISGVVEKFLNDLTTYELKGHTLDCIGVLDERTGTLISGDGLQGAGVGKYRCLLTSKDEYVKTIEKIKQDNRIENILFSHAYEPWNKDGVFGREEVEKALKDCINYIKGV
jgi:glyoxylase-like metal-dependent hydrolase (beta-lactamase superfamily II)